MKCDLTVEAAAYYFDILPSGSVPVTQRWTSLLILITTPPTHHKGTQSNWAQKSGCWAAYQSPRYIQIRMAKSNRMRTTKVRHTACSEHNFTLGKLFSAPSKKKKQKKNQLSLSPAWSPFLRTLKSQNHFPFSSHSDVPQKSPQFILALISYSEGKTKEFSETLTLLSWRGNWAYTATVVW